MAGRSSGPGLVERRAVPADLRHRAQEGIDLEASGEDQHVEFVQAAIARANASGLDAFDRLGDQRGVRLLDGLVEVRRHDQALARRAMTRAKTLAQLGVSHVVLEIRHARCFDRLDLWRVGVHHDIGEALRKELRQVGV